MTLDSEIIYLKNAGRMNKDLILVTSNPLDIPERLRALDPDLFVMYNPGNDMYEIHRRGCYNSLELSLPYEQLDIRALTHYLNSRDVKKVEKEIDEHNARIDREKENRLMDEMGSKARDVHTYCIRHVDKEFPDKDAYKNTWV